MDENTTKIIKEKFDALPESVQEVILSSDYQDTLIKIGQQYNLNVEQIGILERETTLTMMGLTSMNNFEIELTRELNIDKEKGAQIVKEIDEKVFLKIRDLLKLMNTPAGEDPKIEEETTETPVKNVSTQTMAQETAQNNAGTQMFKEHGIEIIPEKLELQNMKQAPSILNQKLSNTVMTPSAKTEHSLNNITQANAQDNKPKVDPYREIPE
jgi:hypothetical protein